MNALEKLKLSKELRGLLGGMDGLKAMEKLKAAKRVRELVVLLGGGGQSDVESNEDSASQADQYKKIAHYFAVNYQALKGERRERFIEEIIPDLDAIIRGLELIKADSIQELNDFKQGKIKPSKIVGSGYINPKSIARNWLEEKVANDEAILQAAIQLQNAQNTASNPLYQSVIDGAEINISLIERVIEEAKKNGDDETHGQLVQAIDVIKAWAREQGMPDEAFDSLFDSLYNEDYEPFYYTDRMLLIDGL